MCVKLLRHARLPSASQCSSDVSSFSPFQSITILPLLDLSRDFMARNPRTHSPGHHTSDSCLQRPVVPGIHPSLLPPFVFHPPPFFHLFSICVECYQGVSKSRNANSAAGFLSLTPPKKLLIQDDEQIQHFRQGSV